MKAKPPLVLATGILSGVTLSLVCVGVALFWEGRSLRHQLTSTTIESARLRLQQESAEDDLEAQRAQLDALATEVEQLRQAAAAPGDGDAATRQARRARVYLGDRVVGLGWVWASPPGTNNQDSGAASLANVMLDLQPEALAGSPRAAGDVADTSPARGYAYQYWSQPYAYWPYLYTSGWIEWPGYTNPPALNGGVSLPPADPPSTRPPAPSVTPAPTFAAVPRGSPAAWRTRFPPAVSATPYPRTAATPRSAPGPSFNRGLATAPAAVRGSAPGTAAQRTPVTGAGRVSAGSRR